MFVWARGWTASTVTFTERNVGRDTALSIYESAESLT
jgi:hypothetical protein